MLLKRKAFPRMMNLDNSSKIRFLKKKAGALTLSSIGICYILPLGREPFSYKKPGQSRAYHLSKQGHKDHALSV